METKSKKISFLRFKPPCLIIKSIIKNPIVLRGKDFLNVPTNLFFDAIRLPNKTYWTLMSLATALTIIYLRMIGEERLEGYIL